MKKIFITILSMFLLTGCDAAQYSLIDLPSEEISYLEDYKVKILDANFADTAYLRLNTREEELLEYSAPNGKQYLNVAIELTRFVTNKQSDDHTLDEDDFKIKDHKGISLSLTPAHFSTVDSLTDYTWKDIEITPGDDPTSINLNFELNEEISFDKHYIVLEIDFFKTRVGIDVPLTYLIN